MIAPRQVPKYRRVLRALLERPAIHRFEAERDPRIADHVLPTTVDQLQRRFGITIERRLVKVPGHQGATALVAEYRLDDADRERVREILAATEMRF